MRLLKIQIAIRFMIFKWWMTETNREESIFAIPLLYNAGSGVSIKLLSALKLLSATGICIGRAVMALLFFFLAS